VEYLDYEIVKVTDKMVTIKIIKQKYRYKCSLKQDIILFKSRGYKLATWGYADYFSLTKTFYLMGDSVEPENYEFAMPAEIFPLFRLIAMEYNLYMTAREKHGIS